MTGRTRIHEDNIFLWVVAGSLGLSVALGLITALAVSPKFGLSLFAGGILATLNFLRLRRGLEAVLQTRPENATRFATFRFILRLAVMAILLYVLIVHLHADIIGLLLGLSVLVINITAFSIYLSTRKGG